MEVRNERLGALSGPTDPSGWESGPIPIFVILCKWLNE